MAIRIASVHEFWDDVLNFQEFIKSSLNDETWSKPVKQYPGSTTLSSSIQSLATTM